MAKSFTLPLHFAAVDAADSIVEVENCEGLLRVRNLEEVLTAFQTEQEKHRHFVRCSQCFHGRIQFCSVHNVDWPACDANLSDDERGKCIFRERNCTECGVAFGAPPGYRATIE